MLTGTDHVQADLMEAEFLEDREHSEICQVDLQEGDSFEDACQALQECDREDLITSGPLAVTWLQVSTLSKAETAIDIATTCMHPLDIHESLHQQKEIKSDQL